MREVVEANGHSVKVYKDGEHIYLSPLGKPAIWLDRDNAQALIVKLLSVLRHADRTVGDSEAYSR